jgi:hypothetical protein
MFSAAYKKRLATAMAGAALASALVVPGASADPHAIDTARAKLDDAIDKARAGDEYQDLRNPDTRGQAEGYAPTPEPPLVADEPSEPTGFDLASAAIGAVAAGGLSLVLMATLGTRRPPRRRPAGA